MRFTRFRFICTHITILFEMIEEIDYLRNNFRIQVEAIGHLALGSWDMHFSLALLCQGLRCLNNYARLRYEMGIDDQITPKISKTLEHPPHHFAQSIETRIKGKSLTAKGRVTHGSYSSLTSSQLASRAGLLVVARSALSTERTQLAPVSSFACGSSISTSSKALSGKAALKMGKTRQDI